MSKGKFILGVCAIIVLAVFAFYIGKPLISLFNDNEESSTSSSESDNDPADVGVMEPEEAEEPEEPEVTEPETVEIEVTNEDGTVEKHTITSDQLPQVGSITNDGNRAAFMARTNEIMGEHTDGVLRSSNASMRWINSEISGFSDGVTKKPGFRQEWADQGTIWSANAANETQLSLAEMKEKMAEQQARIDALSKVEQVELYNWCVEEEIYNNIVYTDMVYQTVEPVDFFSLSENSAATISDFRVRTNEYCDMEKREAAGLPVGKDAFITYDSSKYSETEGIMSHLEKTDEAASYALSALELFGYYTPVGIEKRTTSGVFHMVPTADDRVSFAVWTTDPQFQETDYFLVYQLKVKTNAGEELVLDEIGVNLRDGRFVRFAAAKQKIKRSSSTTTTTTTTTKEQEQDNNPSSSSGDPSDTSQPNQEVGKTATFQPGNTGTAMQDSGTNEEGGGKDSGVVVTKTPEEQAAEQAAAAAAAKAAEEAKKKADAAAAAAAAADQNNGNTDSNHPVGDVVTSTKVEEKAKDNAGKVETVGDKTSNTEVEGF